eukprot:6394332-Amphidinium_carterae.1
MWCVGIVDRSRLLFSAVVASMVSVHKTRGSYSSVHSLRERLFASWVLVHCCCSGTWRYCVEASCAHEEGRACQRTASSVLKDCLSESYKSCLPKEALEVIRSLERPNGEVGSKHARAEKKDTNKKSM